MVNAGRRYEIETPLGKGGFGTVYRARFVGEGGFSKVVALKVLNENMADLEDVLARLRDEARLLGLLRHRAIVRADRLVRLANRWAVVMEYVEGADLKRVLAETTVPVGAAVEIVGEVAGALHSAWNTVGPDGQALRLMHRDIKPSNIVLTSYGEIKVLDFGIARADFGTREAETRAYGMGSLPYMAPERLDFRDTAAADVYALGVVFFELITGRAFGRASAVPERHTKHVDAALRFLVEQDLGNRDLLLFLGSLLAYDPDDRPSAGQLERMCVNLRRRFEDEPLRYWSEQVVPGILTSIAKLPADGLTGSALVEQTEGTFAGVPGGSASDSSAFRSAAAEAASTGSGSFRKPVAQVGTGTGSGAFRQPVAQVGTGSGSTGSGTFSRPAAQAGASTGSSGSGAFREPAGEARTGSTGSREIPPPPPPPVSGAFPRPTDRSGELGPMIEPPGEEGSRPEPKPTTIEPKPKAPATGAGGLSVRWMVIGVLVLLLVIASGLGIGFFLLDNMGRPDPSPEQTSTQLQPPQPEPAEPTPQPAVPDAAPEPPTVAPQPEPPVEEPPAQASPPAQPEPREPRPVAPQPNPEPKPEPEPGASTASQPDVAAEVPRGQVEVAGDAEEVVLVGTEGRYTAPATVPEGSYTIHATFPGREAVVAGRVAVHRGATTTIRCSSGFSRCKAD
jgi:serine/threonine protein kinase